MLLRATIVFALHAAAAHASRYLRGTDEELLIGWKGETFNADRNRVMTQAEKLNKEDRERGTWVEQVSWEPRAYVLHNFMTDAECDELIRIAKPRLARSGVIDEVTGAPKEDDIRTSHDTFLLRHSKKVIADVEERLARFTMLPWSHGEDLLILRYQHGEKYDAHQDVADTSSNSGRLLSAEGGHRAATVLMYLSDVEEGGETAFVTSKNWIDPESPKLNGPWSPCADGKVAVKPRKGEALLFWNLKPNGKIDHRSTHAGCPVIKGEKWTATKWIHQDPFRWTGPPPPPRPPGCYDDNDSCATWASRGECKANPQFMVGDVEIPGFCRKSCRAC